MDAIPCPQCGLPAEITERFVLGSTDGPVEHVKTGCVAGHWLTPPVWLLAAAGAPEPAPERRAAAPVAQDRP